MTDAFTQAQDINTSAPQGTSLDQLVGEGKKFTDTEALAKGKFESDLFIKQLQEENATLRTQTEKASTVDEVLAQIKAMNVPVEQVMQPSVETPSVPVAPVDMNKTIREELLLLNVETTREQNKKTALDQLASIVGTDNVAYAIKSKAEELGCHPEFLQTAAEQSSEAFLTYFRNPGDPAPRPTSQGMNTQGFGNSGVDPSTARMAELNALRKTDKKAFHSASVQNEIMSLAAQQIR